ncbi:MAG TPA: TonB-dependent receptor [Rhizomicrobium sp.]|jgi:TonB-dependent receptor
MAFSRWGALRSILFGGVAVLSINAAAAAQGTAINLQEQPLSDALRSVAQKTGESILFTPESVEGLKAPAISGTMNAQQAVSMLTQGTDLEVVSDGNNGLIVRRPFMRHAAEQAPSNAGGGAAPVESVVVNGFKASLERALDKKREAANSEDSILAEDIAKFPDINLSESIQRLPGVALARDQGEGREIAVRGLSPLFTRVRVNGMEAITTTGSEDVNGGTNRGRSFDFNVFASDLFSGITVHKTSEADIEEGALGATVDLHTPHPFDHQGFTLASSFEGGYNDLAGTFNPRGSVLVSDTFLGGTLGVLLSGAYGIYNITEEGSSSVRFQNDNTNRTANGSAPLVAGCVTNNPGTTNQCSTAQRFGSVTVQGTGLPGTIAQTSGTVETAGSVPNGANYNANIKPNDYDVVNEAYHPRFPRYDLVFNHEKRAGVVSSVQWQPDDATLFTLDGLFSDFDVIRNEQQLEAPSLSINGTSSQLAPANYPALLAQTLGTNSINVLNYTVNEPTNNLTSMSATGVGLRSEHRLVHYDTRFQQITLDGSHEFSDSFKVHGIIGYSQSNFRNPYDTTLTMDYNCTAATSNTGAISGCPGGQGGGAGTAANPFTYNYAGVNQYAPSITYGNVDVTSPNGWFLSQDKTSANDDYNSYRTAALDADYKVNNTFRIQGGAEYKNFGYGTVALARSNGTTATLQSYIPADMEAHSALANFTELVSLHGITVGPGTPTTWLVPDVNKAISMFNILSPTAENGAFALGPQPSLSSNGTVRERDASGWAMLDWDSQIGSVPFRGNIGLRYALTSAISSGFSYNASTATVSPVTVGHTYHDWLPSLNAVLTPVDDFLIRFSAAQEISRPDLSNLLPGATVTKSGANPLSVTSQNPNLNPYRDKALDLSFEWYYDKGSLFSIAFFYKHLDDLIVTQTVNVPYEGNPFGLPDSLALAACGGVYTQACNPTNIAQFKSTINQKGSPLYGTEINWEQPFTFLPDFWSNFGYLGNVTFVQAQQTYLNPDGTVQAIADLTNLSRTSFNSTLYYDDSVFQARISAAFRSKYIPNGGVNPGGLNDVTIARATLNVDFSSSYKINDEFTVSAEALNLTNQPSTQYVDSVGRRDYYNHYTGREFMAGVRFNY